MAARSGDPVLDRLLRHMAWANQATFKILEGLPTEHLELHAPKEPEWSVREIACHLARSADFYCWRIGAETAQWPFSEDAAGTPIPAMAEALREYDVVLRGEAHKPDAPVTYVRDDGASVVRARSTILAQAVHHATEHRAQMSGILAAHGIRAINLDEFDVWAHADAEGLGD